MGESNTCGNGAGTGGNAITDCRIHSFSYQLAALMNSQLIAAHEDSIMGMWGPGSSETTVDSRVTITSGWVNALASLGGALMSNSTTTNALTITPKNSVDTFKLWYVRSPGKDTVNIAIDGGSPATGGTTINANGTQTVQTATFTAASAAVRAISITRTAIGTGFDLIGWEAWDSTRSMVSFTNAGISGNHASNLASTTNAYASLNAMAAFAPDVLFLWLGQNDAVDATSISSYKTDMQSIITTGKISGDVLLMACAPFSITAASMAAQIAIRQAQIDLAASNDLPLIDPWTLFGGDYNLANADGLMTNTVHENVAGYSQIAALAFASIKQVPAI